MKIFRQINPQWMIGLSFALLTIFWIAIRLPSVAQAIMDADSGHQLAGALQILHDEHPFVDYEATYGPLTFYASALAQIIFGQRFIAEIILNILGYAIAYSLLALLIYRITGKTSLVFFFGILAVLAMPRLYKYYIVLGPTLTLWFAARYIDQPKLRNIFWMALALVIAGLFRSDLGIYCTIAATLVVVLQPSYKADALKRVFTLWGETFLLALPWLLFLAYKGALQSYFYDSVIGSLSIVSGMYLGFPVLKINQNLFSEENLLFITTTFFFSFPFITLLFLAFKWKFLEENHKKILLAVTVLYLLSITQALSRMDYSHLLQTMPLAFVLGAWMVSHLLPVFKRTFSLSLAFTLFLCVMLSMPIFLMGKSGWAEISLGDIPDKISQFSLPKEQMLVNANDRQRLGYATAMLYIRRCTTDQTRLMALPALTTFMYFTDRAFGGGQIGVVSGYFVTQADQQRIVATMKKEDIPMIIYSPNYAFDNLPERRLEVVAPTVAKYIMANYRSLQKIGRLDLLLRRNLVVKQRGNGLDHYACPVPRS